MNAKQIAIEISTNSITGVNARYELKKMFGKDVKFLTNEQKLMGLSCLEAFWGIWDEK